MLLCSGNGQAWFLSSFFLCNVSVFYGCKSHNGCERPSPTCPPLRDPSGYKVTPTNTLLIITVPLTSAILFSALQLLQMAILHEHYYTRKFEKKNTSLWFIERIGPVFHDFISALQKYKFPYHHNRKSKKMKISQVHEFLHKQQFSSVQNISELSSTVRILLFHFRDTRGSRCFSVEFTAQLRKHLTSTKSICFLPGTKPISEGTPCEGGETPQVKGEALVLITVHEHEEKGPFKN